MKLDRKGDIGFMEAMAGAMTVCLVLTSFSAFLAADLLSEEPPEPEFDWTSIGALHIHNGNFGMGLNTDFKRYIQDNGFKGIQIRASVLLDGYSPNNYKVGETSDVCVKETKAVEIPVDNERNVPGIIEVTIYL